MPGTSHLPPGNFPRRSHLESDTYRSFVRILSHFRDCLDHGKVSDAVPAESGGIEIDVVRSEIIDDGGGRRGSGLDFQKGRLFRNPDTRDVARDGGVEEKVASGVGEGGRGRGGGREVLEEENDNFIVGRDTAGNGNSNDARVFLGEVSGQGDGLLDLDDASFSGVEVLDLENGNHLGMLAIEKEPNDCISSPVKQFPCHDDKLQDKPSEHEALEKFDSLDHGVPLVAVSGDGNVNQVHKESDAITKTSQLGVPEAEISRLVQEPSDDEVKKDMQADAANVSVIYGSRNSDEKMVPIDVNLEEGEILNVLGDVDVDPSSHSQKDNSEIGEHGAEDMSTTFVEKKNIANVMKEDKIVDHDLARRIDSRNASSSIVDYSDLYSSDRAFKKTRLPNLPKFKKGGTQTKKDDGHKLLLSVPKFEKCGNNRIEKDGCHKLLLSPPKDGNGNSLTVKRDNFDVSVHDNLTIPEVFSEKVPNMDLQKESNGQNVEFTEKKKMRKKGPMTEERKARKKIQKKRKRAELNRKLGIKRLKIEPFSMPKKVVYCDFYLKGRCQKGASCTFSHDTTPLTKSQPCKYFACDSCLKGEDCPFDHDLWKYPCHNFTSSGTCIRGETCKFSHKINPVGSADRKSDMLNLSERTGIREPNTSISSKAVNSSPMNPRLNALNTDYTVHKPSAEHLPGPLSRVIPKGITFLSFGEKTPEEHTKAEKKGPLEKHSNTTVSSNAINTTPTNTAMKVPKGINLITLGRNASEDVKIPGDRFFESSDVKIQNKQSKVPTLNPTKLPSVALDLSTTGVVKFPDLISDSGHKESKINDVFTNSASKSSTTQSDDAYDTSKILEEFLFCDHLC